MPWDAGIARPLWPSTSVGVAGPLEVRLETRATQPRPPGSRSRLVGWHG